MAVLDDILAAKRDEITLLRRPDVRALLESQAFVAPAPRDFLGALRRDPAHTAVIAEIKRRSPSKGELAPGLDPSSTAAAYAQGGAVCLSVLTDQLFFGGAIADLQAARAACDLPVLRKDFVLDAVQVYEARAIGADAVLLIVAALPDDARLADLHALVGELGMTALVEVHDAGELERALAIGPRLVGVNARDLGTFTEDLGVGERLVAALPDGVVAVAESAIRSRGDVERMARAGFDAVLVGEALVRSDDPSAAVRELATVARPAGGDGRGSG